jgi:hypothetical protein
MKIRLTLFAACCAVALALFMFPRAGSGSAPGGGPAPAAAQAPMADLIVDSAALRQHWVVRDEYMAADRCSAIEGNITPGDRKIVRFTVSTPNVGDADLVVGDPNEHVADGLFEFATCHNHHHFRNYARYELIDPRTGHVWRAAKRGFCMIDIERYKDYTGVADNKRHFAQCGAIGVPGNQGVSKGWTDIYVWKLAGQFFVLDGGDGQTPVPPGEYIIRITVNPGYVPTKNEVCRHADPNRPGVCHALPESNYENNVGQVTITIPDHPGRQGVGPLKDEPAVTMDYLKGEQDHNH